jgi:hypothetical protein
MSPGPMKSNRTGLSWRSGVISNSALLSLLTRASRLCAGNLARCFRLIRKVFPWATPLRKFPICGATYDLTEQQSASGPLILGQLEADSDRVVLGSRSTSSEFLKLVLSSSFVPRNETSEDPSLPGRDYEAPYFGLCSRASSHWARLRVEAVRCGTTGAANSATG